MDIIGAGQDTARPAPKKNHPPVLDACCGSRMMWYDRKDSRTVFVDKRRETWHRPPSKTHPKGDTIIIDPDHVADFTALPFPDETFFHVVFDPPHFVRSGEPGFLAKTYGWLPGDWRDMLRNGFAECFRVLRKGGTLVFKWTDTDTPLREVLALTPEKPLYGHKTGARARTHWVAFMKQESAVLGEESPAQNTVEICHTAPNSAMVPCHACKPMYKCTQGFHGKCRCIPCMLAQHQ